MRRIFTLMIMVLAVLNLLAQAPQKMTYQAVVRNSANVLIANQNVSARISILQGSAQGASVYVESHSTTTNANGLMSVEIGGGSPTAGVFANIDWSTGPYFLKSEIDPEGGINYSIESVQQLLSVPYALYAKEAGNGFSGDYNDLTNVPTFTESQILSISNDTIYLTGGSFVKLPAGFDGDYNSLTNKPNLFSGAYSDLTGRPNLAPVATSGAYGDLIGQPTIPAEQVNADWIATSGKAQILNKPTLFSGNYNDLTNKPTLFDGNYNSLSNKPILFSGNYNDLTNKPTLFDGNYNSLSNRPNLSAVALSGSYNDLINKPALFDGNYNSLSNRPNLAPVATSGSYADLTNKPNLATVATSGSYNDLSNRPAIPSEQVNADWTATSGKAQILNRPNLAPVATSGNYNDLTNKPTIPAEQVNSDWNATSGKAQILNRPNLAPVATTGNYSDLNGRPNLAPVATTGNYSDLNGRPNLAPVATSGNYNDLNNLPTIPNVPTDVSVFTNDAGYLTRDSLPTNVSGFTNDAGYLTTFTESQILSISNDTIYLTGGSFVKLPAGFDGDYNSLTNKPNLFSGAYDDLTGKPNLAPVATSGNYNDLTNKPTIPTVPTDVSAFNNDAGYLTRDSLPTDVSVFNNDAGYLTRDSLPTNVSGFTNDAGYLTTFTESQILSISNDTIYLTGGSFVKLPAGFDGDYNSLTNKPNLFSGAYDDLTGKPNLAPVATSGNYNDLTNKPTIPTVPTDVSVFNNDAGYLTRDSLPTNVSAFNNDAGYLTRDSLPTSVSAFTNDAGYLTSFTESQILSISNDTIYLTGGSFVKLPAGFDGDYNSLTNRPNLAPVATSGNYSDLNGKPNLAPVATTGNYSDLNDLPTIPNVPTDVSAFNNDAGYLTRDSLPTSVSAFTNDAGYLTSFTESQILSISNDTIYLTGGSFVKLPAGFDGDYNSLTNRPNLAPVATSGNYSDLNGKPNLAPVATTGNYSDLNDLPTIPNVPTDVSAFNNDVGYLTRDFLPTNVSAFTNDAGYLTSFTESQILSISNDTIYLTGGSFVKLPTAEGFSGSYNDLTDKPTIPNVPTNVSAFTNDAGYLTSFTESQILSISNDTIFLTGGSFVKLPAGFDGDYNSLTNKPNLAPVATSGNYSDLNGKPNLAPVATSGNYNDLNDLPTIPTVPTDVSVFNNDAGYLTRDSLPTNVSVFNNDAGYLTSFTESQILSISNDTIYLTGGSFVKLPAGFDGDYNSLTNRPNLAPVATSGNYSDLNGKPNLAPVATSGNYNDLNDLPTIPNVPTDVSVFNNDAGYITAADVPAQVNADWNATTGVAKILNKPTLFSGNYNDLTNKPTIPTVPTDVSAFTNDAGYITAADVPAQVNSDWNATSGVEEILNKPTNVSAFNNDAGYVTQTQLNAANYVTNSGMDCANTVDLCSLLSRLDSLERRLQNMPASNNTSAYGVPLNDTCPQRMVMINGSRNVCYHESSEPNVSFLVFVDGGVVMDATYTWYVDGQLISYHDGFLNYYAGEWGPTHNNPHIFTSKVTMADGCSYLSAPFEVNVYDLPDVIITGSDSVVCEGESVTLRAGLRTPGNPMITYQWYENTLSSNNALSGRTHEDETFKPAFGTTDYIVIVTHLMEDYGCYSLDTFRVRVAECDTAGGTNNPQMALPTVTTDSVMVISSTSANCYGNVAAEGCTAVTARGVCWSTLHNPTINDSHTADSVGIGSFISILTDLVAGTTYYVRAYATNSEGTAYGEETTFTLYLVVPKSGTDNHTMTGNTVTVYDHAGPDANYDNRCWGTLVITAPDSNMLLSISGSYDTYNYYAAQDDHLIIYNGFGTTELIATLRGSGNISNPFFTTQNTVVLRFTSSSYSSTKSGFELFITAIPMNEVPTVTTDTVFNITDYSATCSGNITVNGGVEITAYGVCWGSSHNPTIDGSHTSYSSGTGSFANDITALSANSTYYVRAYATCQHGTIYGNEVSFKTSYGSNGDAQPCQGSHTISDIDGNVYTTVQIGNQCWLAENLRTTRYSDGTPIALGDTLNVVTPYRYTPDFNINYVPEYGYLYNWPAVMHGSSSSISNPSGVQGICPTGWHVPSDSEWTQLTDYLRGPAAYFCNNNNNIAKALTSNTGWQTSIYDCTAGNDMESNNATGFGALPAGHFQGGSYMSFSAEANMWSSSEASNNNVWYRSIARNSANVRRYSGTKSYGYSVRCLRDIASLSAFPVVTTNTVSEIAEITATCGGSVTSNGAIVTARGVCWSTSPNPTIADSHTTDGNGAGSFTSSLTELLRYNTYYVRAYATTDNGTVYGEEFKFTASIYLNGDEFSCSGTPTVTDVEGNIYNTVQIGGQCWMRENLKTTKYADNTLIEVPIYPHASTTTAYRKSPNGKHSNAPTYGYLYNWKAVMHNSSSSTSNPSGVQGVCPIGWHVPSDAEWTQLTEYVKSQSLYCGNSTSSVAKALAAVQDWYNSTDACAVGNNPNENNVTGFWALPAGSYYSDDGYYSSGYYSFATDACFWSATEGSTSSAYNRCLYYNDKNINRSNASKCNYFSVRCLRDSVSNGNIATTQASLPTVITDSATAITATSAVCGGNVTAEGSEIVTKRGVCWGTAHSPTLCGNHKTEGDGTGPFTVNISGLSAGTTYYVRTYAINSVGTVYGEEVSFKTLRDTVGNGLPCPGIPSVADVDGNIYNTVKFLGKCWMKENLKTTRYADGTLIESGDSFSRETPYRYAPDNDTNNIATYGYLYNWPAVMNGSVSNIASPNGVQGICPNGWHVPNYEELYGIPGPFTESGMCSDENDDRFDDEYYQQVGNYACFWCSEQWDYLEAYFLGINYASAIGIMKWKSTGMSVRCVLNEEVATILPTVSTITASNITSTSATCGGNVTSDGGATVTARGVCWSTSQNPTISGNHTTNGSGTGSFTSSLTGLSANTTYYVRAYATNSVGTAYGNEVSFTTTNMDGQSCPGAPTVTDIDGNTYNTVRIGEQCWMKENLRATHYADGSSIPAGGNVASNINPYYYNFSSSTIALDQRGLLYNWQAVMNGAPSSTTNPSGVQGICPMGWHVPSEAEWNQLTDYVSSQSQYKCDNYSSYIAKALASSTSWKNNSYNCTVGNDLSTNNATGFSAVPASWRDSQGFIAACTNAYFWSSSAADSNTAWFRELKHQSAYVRRESVSCFVGFSVRCLRD